MSLQIYLRHTNSCDLREPCRCGLDAAIDKRNRAVETFREAVNKSTTLRELRIAANHFIVEMLK